jgi:uncharacterized oligopeptide transporter (OPT) family protein
MGMLAQLLFARGGPTTSILAGAVVAGNATQTSQTLWAFKAGHDLRASVRAQVVAQIVGVVLGSLVVVPTYLSVVHANPLGTERMPAVAALTWRATAQAMAGGLAGLPPRGLQAAIVAFVVGVALSALARSRRSGMFPSAVTVGIAFIMPLSMSSTILIGAATIALLRRLVSSFDDADGHALGAGALAGESLVGVLLALLTSLGFHP